MRMSEPPALPIGGLACALQLRQTLLQVPSRPRTEPRPKRPTRRHDHQRIQQAGAPARHPHRRLGTSRTHQTIARANLPNRPAPRVIPRNSGQGRQTIPSRGPQSQRGIESTLWLVVVGCEVVVVGLVTGDGGTFGQVAARSGVHVLTHSTFPGNRPSVKPGTIQQHG